MLTIFALFQKPLEKPPLFAWQRLYFSDQFCRTHHSNLAPNLPASNAFDYPCTLRSCEEWIWIHRVTSQSRMPHPLTLDDPRSSLLTLHALTLHAHASAAEAASQSIQSIPF